MAASSAGFADCVVQWQVHSGRNHLPWQATRDPYRVWLSEIMLQQTQVVTVLGYFDRFLLRFPTVSSLASADQDDVLGLWSGLGYYSRARNLHECAKQIVERYAGEFPHTAQLLESLPGIGRSTAAAIASLCFGERVAILDANVKRVLTRVLAFGADLSSPANERQLWSAATDMLPVAGSKDAMARYTQGMMDLGATVCLPRAPMCPGCPVLAHCQAGQRGTPEQFPLRTRKLKRSAQSVWLLWAMDLQGAVWLQRRPSPGVWAGLYCLPWFESREALLEVLPGTCTGRLQDLAVTKHVLTHKDMYLHPVQVSLPRSDLRLPAGRWFEASAWLALGLPAPIRQMLDQA